VRISVLLATSEIANSFMKLRIYLQYTKAHFYWWGSKDFSLSGH